MLWKPQILQCYHSLWELRKYWVNTQELWELVLVLGTDWCKNEATQQPQCSVLTFSQACFEVDKESKHGKYNIQYHPYLCIIPIQMILLVVSTLCRHFNWNWCHGASVIMLPQLSSLNKCHCHAATITRYECKVPQCRCHNAATVTKSKWQVSWCQSHYAATAVKSDWPSAMKFGT
jgi:hypothetical protein